LVLDNNFTSQKESAEEDPVVIEKSSLPVPKMDVKEIDAETSAKGNGTVYVKLCRLKMQ
jgi:hypothetical protein